MEKMARVPRITRTRNGCLTCRRRKKRCDEKRPICSACTRLGLQCDAPQYRFRFVSTMPLAATAAHGHNETVDAGPSQRNTQCPRPQLPMPLSTDASNRDQSPECLSITSSIDLSPSESVFHGPAGGLTPVANPSGTVFNPDVVESWFGEACQHTMLMDMAGDTTSSLSNSHGPSDLHERLYLHHWKSQVLQVLPSVFQKIDDMMIAFPALKAAVVALSSAHMAYTQVRVNPVPAGESRTLCYIPDGTHQQNAINSYERALKLLGETIMHEREHTLAIFATLLIFIYIELLIGSFRGMAFHEQGIERLLATYTGIHSLSAINEQLTVTWLYLRALTWSCRIPFTVPAMDHDLQRFLGLTIQPILGYPGARPAAVAVNLIESHRLAKMILFERYVGRGDQEYISERCIRDWSRFTCQSNARPPWRPKGPVADEDYLTLIAEHRHLLDDWHSSLHLDALPIASFHTTDDSLDRYFTTGPGADYLAQFRAFARTNALRFRTHLAAVDYMLYVTARVCQSTDILSEWVGRELVPPSRERGDSWIFILMRVLAGLDLQKCNSYDIFTLNLSLILSILMVACPSTSKFIGKSPRSTINAFIHGLLAEQMALCFTPGIFFLTTLKHQLRVIEKEADAGRELFYIIGGTPDTTRSFTDNVVENDILVVYGKDLKTGKFFSDSVDFHSLDASS